MKIIAVLGSRNPSGQTARATDAFLQGAVKAGWQTESLFLPRMKIEHCRQCDDSGWGTCRSEGRCCIQDDMPLLVEKLATADAVVFATPVYFGDLSESMRALTDRLRRTCRHENGKTRMNGKRAIGICVAGGGGGGAPSCALSLEKVLTTCGFDVVDMAPARRQNLEMKIMMLGAAGEWLARLYA